MSDSIPSLEEQSGHWDAWNCEARALGPEGAPITPYMASLRAAAVRWAGMVGERPRILEVGCGTGWICEALAHLGPVVGIDLSPAAIDAAKRHYPSCQFYCGDFLSEDLPGPFDVIVSADTIAHVPDQQRFVDRFAALIVPGGRLVLMSQNAYAVRRSSWVDPAPPYIRRWPSLGELRRMLRRDFDIVRITTAGPLAATSGIYRFFNSRRVWHLLCTLIDSWRAIALYERLWLGSEWVVVATRR